MRHDYITDPAGQQHQIDKWGYENGSNWEVGGSVPQPSSWSGRFEEYAIRLNNAEPYLYAVVVGHVLVEVSDAVHNFRAQKNLYSSKGVKIKYDKASKSQEQEQFWPYVEQVLLHGDRVMLYGVPGTGKTTTAYLVDPERTDKVTLTEETPASSLLGHWMPEGDHFKWHNGIAINAWLKGRRLLVDEIDRGSGDVQTLMYAIADDPMVATLTLPTGDVVKPAPGFAVVLTMNGEPNDLPTALVDRFSTQINIDRPHPKAIASLPEDLRQVALNGFLIQGERSASIRSWKAFGDLREKTNEDIAAFAVFGNRASEFLNAVKMSRSK